MSLTLPVVVLPRATRPLPHAPRALAVWPWCVPAEHPGTMPIQSQNSPCLPLRRLPPVLDPIPKSIYGVYAWIEMNVRTFLIHSMEQIVSCVLFLLWEKTEPRWYVPEFADARMISCWHHHWNFLLLLHLYLELLYSQSAHIPLPIVDNPRQCRQSTFPNWRAIPCRPS